jgi:nucleoside-diphosphate-sugar epimerase
MRILITGGTGFVGSHTARTLLRSGHDVRLVVRDGSAARAQRVFADPDAPTLVRGDVTDPRSIRAALDGCDAVVHCAGVTPMHPRGADGEALASVNVGGTRAVVGGASEIGLRAIVYVSSITAIFHTDARKMTADAPIARSRHPYGRSKAEAERYVRGLQAAGHPVSIVYPGGVLGPDDPGLSAAAMALRYRMTSPFRITSGGAQQIDVRDLAAIIAALATQTTGSGRYLTAGHFLSWPELADLLERLTGCRLERVPTPGVYLRLLGHAADLLRRVRPVASPLSAENMRYATQWPPMENSPALARLGIELRPAAETFRDTLRWMCAAGHLDRQTMPRLFDGP